MQSIQSTRDLLDQDVIAQLSRLVLRPRGLVEGSFTGLHKSPHRGSSVEFAEYRKYVKGDDIRYIDWRAYARSDRFYLKEFEADTHMRCHLVVDASGSMGYMGEHGSRLEYACRLAATIAYLVVHQGDHVGLLACSEDATVDIPPRGKPSHLRYIFDTLDQLRPQGHTSLITALHDLAERIRKRAMVIVLSDCFEDPGGLLSCFQHLQHRKHDLAVFHLLDPQEMSFAFDRPVRFQDLESSFHLVTEPVSIRRQYLDAFQDYMEQIRVGCGQVGIDYRTVTLNTPYQEVLGAFMLERSGR